MPATMSTITEQIENTLILNATEERQNSVTYYQLEKLN